MAEIDLVPADYRRLLKLRNRLRTFAVLYLGVVVFLGTARVGIGYGVQTRGQEIERLEAARALEQDHQRQLEALREENAEAATLEPADLYIDHSSQDCVEPNCHQGWYYFYPDSWQATAVGPFESEDEALAAVRAVVAARESS